MYGPGGLSKNIMWPILAGETESPADDKVVGWAPGKWHHKGFRVRETFEAQANMTTEQILQKCGNRAYSLKGLR